MTALSPRTSAEPMAFTVDEFLRGAIVAWLWFIGLSTIVWFIVSPAIALVAAVFSLPWSIGGLLAFLLPARVLGWSLRRVATVWVHVVAFAVLGVAIGPVMTIVFSSLTSSSGYDSWSMTMIVNLLASACAVPLGWSHAYRRGVRNDQGRTPTRASTDPDAAAEDALAGDQSG